MSEHNAFRASMDRPCQLCGQPMGKHIAPPYGERLAEVGAMGLLCPPLSTPEHDEAFAQLHKAGQGLKL